MTPSPSGFVLWFTGLPCSGKTTLARAVTARLEGAGKSVVMLDGDEIRRHLCQDLGFSKKDRLINISRVAYVAGLLARSGAISVVSLVSPYREARLAARAMAPAFVEAFVSCSLEVCENRDVKGMYRLARAGKIRQFTGVSDVYEEPDNPELVIRTDRRTAGECVEEILSYLESSGLAGPFNPFVGDPVLTKAFELARACHAGQFRRGRRLPYLTHPISVARLLSRHGYPKPVVAAGLLHDVLEDSGCEIEDIVKTAGRRAAALVAQVTDRDKTLPWKARKALYLKHLRAADKDALAVACADKADNLASIADDYRLTGKEFLKKFSAKMKDKLANYEQVYRFVRNADPACRILPVYKQRLEEVREVFPEPR